jgi:hypothetical protein
MLAWKDHLLESAHCCLLRSIVVSRTKGACKLHKCGLLATSAAVMAWFWSQFVSTWPPGVSGSVSSKPSDFSDSDTRFALCPYSRTWPDTLCRETIPACTPVLFCEARFAGLSPCSSWCWCWCWCWWSTFWARAPRSLHVCTPLHSQ